MRIATLACMAFTTACGGGGGGNNGDDSGSTSVFDPSVKTVEFEIDYETGDAPYTGPIVGFGDTFDLSYANLDRVFSGTKTLILPRTTGEMQDIGAVDDEEITSADALALADKHRDKVGSADTHTYYLVWVSGHFADDTGVQDSVLGVSFGNTGVIVMFKDVIAGASALPNIDRFVEQSTMIHELGHAIGLVDNGVAMIAPHKDEPHGAHCTNDHCTMFWLNEGASDAAEFARKYVVSGDAILFGPECLADVDALTR
jgi:hypothetical protein